MALLYLFTTNLIYTNVNFNTFEHLCVSNLLGSVKVTELQPVRKRAAYSVCYM